MAIKLLTPELKQRVENRMRECFAKAEQKYRIKFVFPEIRYNIRNHVGGMAYNNQHLVRFNLIFLIENTEKYLATTVAHEVAHCIVTQCFTAGIFKLPEGKKRKMPHGKEWQEVMNLLGVEANVTHTYDCSSIEHFSKKNKINIRKNEVRNIMNRILKLSKEDEYKLTEEIHALGLGIFSSL